MKQTINSGDAGLLDFLSFSTSFEADFLTGPPDNTDKDYAENGDGNSQTVSRYAALHMEQ